MDRRRRDFHDGAEQMRLAAAGASQHVIEAGRRDAVEGRNQGAVLAVRLAEVIGNEPDAAMRQQDVHGRRHVAAGAETADLPAMGSNGFDCLVEVERRLGHTPYLAMVQQGLQAETGGPSFEVRAQRAGHQPLRGLRSDAGVNEQLAVQSGWRMEYADIGAARLEIAQDLRRVHDLEIEADVGQYLLDGRQHGRNPTHAGVAHGQADAAADGMGLEECPHEIREPLLQRRRGLDEPAPVQGCLHIAAVALEQYDAQHLFDFPHPSGNRALRRMQVSGGGREGPQSIDGTDRLDLDGGRQFHDPLYDALVDGAVAPRPAFAWMRSCQDEILNPSARRCRSPSSSAAVPCRGRRRKPPGSWAGRSC